MKIISGQLKGRNIAVPQNSTIEPVKSEVRNAILTMLSEKVTGANCLDLFAGSGSLGLEALSRGAKACLFVEGDKDSAATIQANIEELALSEQAQVLCDSVKRAVNKFQMTNDKWSIVFIDPPYVTPVNHLLKLLSTILQENGFVVYLCGTSSTFRVPEGLELIQERCYGQTKVVILRKNYDTIT